MLTNKDLVLNELEHTWNEIDKEIKRVADNDGLESPEIYNMSSVGHKVYQTEYERKDLRGQAKEQYAVADLKNTDSDYVIDKLIQMGLGEENPIEAVSIRNQLNIAIEGGVDIKLMDFNEFHLSKNMNIKQFLIDLENDPKHTFSKDKYFSMVGEDSLSSKNNLTLTDLISVHQKYRSDYLKKKYAYENTKGRLVGIYKVNGEYHDNIIETKGNGPNSDLYKNERVVSNPEHLIGMAYVGNGDYIEGHEIYSDILGSVLGYITGPAKGKVAEGINEVGNSLVKKCSDAVANISKKFDDIALNTTESTLNSEIAGSIINSRDTLSDSLKELSENYNLDGLDSESAKYINMLKTISVALLPLATPSMVIGIAFSAGLTQLISSYNDKTSEENGLVEFERYLALEHNDSNPSVVKNVLVDRIDSIDGKILDFANVIADGKTKNIIAGNEDNNRIEVVSGNDNELYGLDGNDTLIGSEGTDRLNGGKGEDKYIFGINHGHDIIKDENNEWGQSDIRGEIVLQGILLDLVKYERHYNDLKIITGHDSSITIEGYFKREVVEGKEQDVQADFKIYGNELGKESFSVKRLSHILMQEDTHKTLYGTDVNETIKIEEVGNILFKGDLDGEYTIKSSGGNDTFIGSTGNDRYIYTVGDGNLIIEDYEEKPITPTNDFQFHNTGEDTLEILGATVSDIVLSTAGDDLVLTFAGRSANSITIKNHFASGLGNRFGKPIDYIKVSGTTVDIRASLDPLKTLIGTAIVTSEDFKEDITNYSLSEHKSIKIDGLTKKEVFHYREIDESGTYTDNLILVTLKDNEVGQLRLENFYKNDIDFNGIEIEGEQFTINNMSMNCVQWIDASERFDVTANDTVLNIHSYEKYSLFSDIFKSKNRFNLDFDDDTNDAQETIVRRMRSASGENESFSMVAGPMRNPSRSSFIPDERKATDKILMRDYSLDTIDFYRKEDNLTIRVMENGQWKDKVNIYDYFTSNNSKIEILSIPASNNNGGGDFSLEALVKWSLDHGKDPNHKPNPIDEFADTKLYLINEDGSKTELDYPEVNLVYDGETKDMHYNPYNKDGNTMVSLFEFNKQLDNKAEITWDNDEKRAYITQNGKTSWIDYNDHKNGLNTMDCNINGENKKMRTAPDIICTNNESDYTLMVHIGTLADIYGLEVSWLGEKNIAMLETPFENLENEYETLNINDVNDPVVYGTAKNEIIETDKLNDTIYAGSGDDRIYANSGDDEVYGQNGNDIIFDGCGNDKLYGGAGNDRLNANRGDDQLYGEDGDDCLVSYDGSNTLNGGAGNDIIRSYSYLGRDTLIGESGDDTLYGQSYTIFDGGTGNDSIHGGYFENTYYFKRGDGLDEIYTSENSNDTIVFDDYSIDDIQMKIGYDENDLVIESKLNADKIIIKEALSNTQKRINRIVFADGAEILGQDAQKLMASFDIIGTDATDDLSGSIAIDGEDSFEGKKGDDILRGQAGDDIYIFNAGDGIDTIIESGGNDTIRFNDYTLSDLEFIQGNEEYNLRIRSLNGLDEIRIKMGSDMDSEKIEKLIFSDGTVFEGEDAETLMSVFNTIGTEGDDELYGVNDFDGHDILEGKKGNDKLFGLEGNDTYIFSSGDGIDRIYEKGFGMNKLVFKDYSKEELEFTMDKSGKDIIIRSKTGHDAVHIISGMDLHKNISSIEFSDGTRVSGYEALKLLKFKDIHGTDSDDVLYGADAESGWDSLYGGLGNDLLIGRSGMHEFHFEDEFGQDIIESCEKEYQVNVYFDFAVDKASFKRVQDDLLIYKDANNYVRMKNFFLTESTYHEIRFNDKETGESDSISTSEIGQMLDEIIQEAPSSFSGNIVLGNIQGLEGDGKDLLEGVRIDLIEENGAALFTVTDAEGYYKFDKLLPGKYEVRIRQTLGEYALVSQPGSTENGVAYIELVEGENQSQAVFVYETDASIYSGVSADDSIYNNSDEVVIEQEFEAYDFLIKGNEADNVLYGSSKNDAIKAGVGNDILVGGDGSDIMAGSLGDDVYIYSKDHGKDSIIDTDGLNKLLIRDYEIKDATFEMNGEDLIIKFSDSDQIILKEYDIENISIEFSNGQCEVLPSLAEKIIRGDERSNRLSGTNDVEQIFAYAGDDRLKGSGGDDFLFAGSGKDRVYGESGNDSLFGNRGQDILNGGFGNDLLYGGSGDDSLKGESGTDTLTGGIGNDRLEGGLDADVYIFEDGFGQDVIRDYEFSVGYNEDLIHFKDLAGVEEIDFIKTSRLGDLIIKIKNSEDQVLIEDYFRSERNKIEQVKFGESDPLVLEELILEKGIIGTGASENIYGSEAADKLYGLDGDDRLYSYDGDDILSGGAGDDYLESDEGQDLLIGGTGNDRLKGGRDADTYIFENCFGQDTLYDFDVAGDINKDQIHFKDLSGIDNLSFVRPSGKYDLLIKVNGTDDQVLIEGYFRSFRNRVETIRFGDQPAVNLETLIREKGISGTQESENLRGTAGNDKYFGEGGNDNLYGQTGNDELYGGIGNDYLSGGVDDDLLCGGSGNDQLYGGSGNDKYVFGLEDEGLDKIVDTSGDDILFHEADITDVIFDIKRNDLILKVNDTSSEITIKNNSIEQYNFGGTNCIDQSAVNQMIQSMNAFCENNGIATWEEALDTHRAEAENLILSIANAS